MNHPDRITLISIYHFCVAGLFLLLSCALLMVPVIVGLAAESDQDARTAVPIVAVVMLVGVVFALAYALANALAGWGLWKLQPWGRWLAIAVSALGLFISIPISTIIRGFILWYLFQPEVEAAFRRNARTTIG